MDLLVQDKKLKNHVDEEDTVFTDLPDFSAVEKVSEPIKQFKRISRKEEGNLYTYLKVPSFQSIQIWHICALLTMYHQMLGHYFDKNRCLLLSESPFLHTILSNLTAFPFKFFDEM